MKKIIFTICLAVFLLSGLDASANFIFQKNDFYIDPSYDLEYREKIEAVLVRIDSNVYFYVDEEWWQTAPQDEVYYYLSELGQEFDKNIYPNLTSFFGQEWKPGIDKDQKITVLIHPMRADAGGYFRSNDQYLKVQVTNSNEREMIYLNASHITSDLSKSLLAHEFVHLITFNQKDRIHGITEEIWLNEARAEYAPTLLGYDDNFSSSNLERRVKNFLEDPFNSIVNWSNSKQDYASINLFTQYLVDHYGVKTLIDSLQSNKVGIESINYALEKNGFEKNFSDIFIDWTITVAINDCKYGEKYCYLNPLLKNLTISPKINFLPLSGESSLKFADFTRMWKGNWYKIIGGNNNLKISFSCRSGSVFKVPYIVQKTNGTYEINFLELNNNCTGEIIIKDFGKDAVSLIFIPSVSDLNYSNAVFYPFSWEVSIEKAQDDSALIETLLSQISQIQAEISRLQARIASILNNKEISVPGPSFSIDCLRLTDNLYYGLKNQEVSCLQKFLKSQGADVYPEGLITGYFGELTRSAVARFQEKYKFDILSPLGLNYGTGFVGSATLSKINELLTKLF